VYSQRKALFRRSTINSFKSKIIHLTETLFVLVSINASAITLLLPNNHAHLTGMSAGLLPNPVTRSKHNTHLRFRTKRIGSPLPAGSKNVVQKFLSVNKYGFELQKEKICQPHVASEFPGTARYVLQKSIFFLVKRGEKWFF
jgi:hypothetical protein